MVIYSRISQEISAPFIPEMDSSGYFSAVSRPPILSIQKCGQQSACLGIENKSPEYCSRCEIRYNLFEIRKVFVWSQDESVMQKLRRLVYHRGVDVRIDDAAKCLVVVCTRGSVFSILQKVRSYLSTQELHDARVIGLEEDRDVEISDIGLVINLFDLCQMQAEYWLFELLKDDRLSAHFQPIFPASVKEGNLAPFGYEALIRGQEKSGDEIPPSRLFSTALRTDLLFRLDLAARRTILSQFADWSSTKTSGARLFINLTPSAIYSPGACLESICHQVENLGLNPTDIVFELIESERVDDPVRLRQVVDVLRRFGFAVALDDVGSAYSSLQMIHEIEPEFIKLDMDLIRNVHLHRRKADLVRHILLAARSIGVMTICEGVETIDELNWLRENNADFVQGFLLGRPATLASGLVGIHQSENIY